MQETLQTLGQLALVSTAVTILVQFLKVKFGTSGNKTLAILIGLSLVGAAIYEVFGHTAYWAAAVNVLVTANALYGLIISRFEPKPTE